MYCTQQMIRGGNFHDWLKNHENCESFPPQNICRVRQHVRAYVCMCMCVVCVYNYVRMCVVSVCMCVQVHIPYHSVYSKQLHYTYNMLIIT